mgnify:FL=1
MERTSGDTEVAAWLAAHPRSAELFELDAHITTAMPRLDRWLWTGRMWGGTDQEIVGYGTILQPRPRGVDVEWFLIGLAVQQRHLSLYVNVAEDGEYLVRRRAASLGNVKVGAAALTFTAVDALDPDGFAGMLQAVARAHPEFA